MKPWLLLFDVGGMPDGVGEAMAVEETDVDGVSIALEMKAIAPSNSSGLALTPA